MGRLKRETIRKRVYRSRLRQQQPGGPGLHAKIAEVRARVKAGAPEELVTAYAKVALQLDRELAVGRPNTRRVQETGRLLISLAEQLQLSPRERRLAGEKDAESISAALATSWANVEKLRAAEWTHLKQEVALFGPKTVGDRAVFREDLIVLIADLKRRRPELFSDDELKLTAEQLFDRILEPIPRRTGAEGVGTSFPVDASVSDEEHDSV